MNRKQPQHANLIQFLTPMCLLAILAGCDRGAVPGTVAVDPQVLAAYQQEFVLADEPDGAQGILDVRTLLIGHDAGDHDHAAHDDDGEHAEHDNNGEHSEDAEHAEHDNDGEHKEHAEHDNDGEHKEHAEHDDDGVHEKHTGDAAGRPVVVVGRTPAATADAWHAGTAAFTMVDPSYVADAAEHEHADGGECKFCASNKTNAEAIVQFLDSDGKPLQIDSRQLFGLQGEELVVVRGSAEITPVGLMITADGLHVRK